MPVDTANSQYTAASSAWQRCRDCFAGSDAVKNQQSLYLPPLDSHVKKPQRYLDYVKRALFFNATRRTIQGLVGAIFQKAPSVKCPENLGEFLKDVTLTGVSADVFARTAACEVLTTGRYAVLVDLTPSGRPYWCGYRAEDVVSWHETVSGGDRVLTQVVLKTRRETQKADDPFVYETEDVYRVLSIQDGRYQAQNWSKQGGHYVGGEVTYGDRRGQALAEIPLWFMGATTSTCDVEPPPLIDLVDVNLSHYRTMADLEHGRHLVALPTPWVAGMLGKGGVLEIGSGVAWQLDVAGRAGMLEFTGAGLASLVTAEQDKRKMMAVLGATLLEEQPRTAETATGLSMRHAGEQASLRSITQVIEDVLTQVLRFSVWWSGSEVSEDEVEYELNKDFFQVKMTGEEFKSQVFALQAGTISYATFYANITTGGLTRPGVTAEDEQEQMELEGPAVEVPAAPTKDIIPATEPDAATKEEDY